LTDLSALLADDALDDQARTGLGRLLEIAQRKVDAAEVADTAGKKRKLKLGLKTARKKLVRFGKKVTKLEPGHITDPDVATLLSMKSFDATQRVDALRAALGL
jgi:alkylhydroperoxidase family enzyme